ncbi:MAG TPA: FAD-dependent monooxygenase [Polyangiaceae bacterium]
MKDGFPETVALELGLDEPDDDAALRAALAKRFGLDASEVPEPYLLKRSLDARRGRARFRLLVSLADPGPVSGTPPREVRPPARVVIVGAGPAGLFCAYELARAGVASIVAERGKPVQPRRRDLRELLRFGRVDGDSNYCFGEGGAGTYSDGKLYTRSHKRGSVRDVLELLVEHQAPPAILSDARPHIGSNRLPVVVTELRRHLESLGVVWRFGARVTDLLTRGKTLTGVRFADGSELEAPCVVLATGHGARDVFDLLSARGVLLEPKPFALGVRVEHPQPLINRIQYGAAAGHPRLPSAAYGLAHQVAGRGVFSFCMCPGGFIVPATTAPGELVVNGMSLSRRDSPFANAGLVASLEPHDWECLGLRGPLGGVALQRRLERAACAAGGGTQRAPATRVTDFLASRGSTTTPATSYIPGLCPGDVGALLDEAGLRLTGALRSALRHFGGSLRGYLTEEAVLVGVESRTSAPVRVTRDPATLQSPSLAGLYPCGEGAGYAGGIMSAALDGMRVARRIAADLAER